MKDTLTQKQETFCRTYFETGNATQSAIVAGYSKHTARYIASENLTKPNICEKLYELNQATDDASVASVLERKQMLTEIIRARMTNYLTCSADGVWMHDIGEETLNSAALKKIRTTTMPFGDKDSNLKIILTEVELRDPMVAIDLLNKMDKLYSEGAGVYIDNRKIEIIVATPTAKKLLTEIVEGKPPHAPDND